MLRKTEQIFRRFFPKRMNNQGLYLSTLKGMHGLEVGGPSPIFTAAGFLPVYTCINGLDGCNFSSNTVWEGSISEGNTYRFGNKKGYQIISDGTKLDMVANGKYDFVLSCHSIEHFANPIKALKEWLRVIKDDGYLLLVVPHKDNTFDNRRPVTKLEHLIKDYENNVEENDSTHFEEINSLHDISMDDGIADSESLRIRTADNFNNRCVHHHVFNTPLVVELAGYLHLKILDVQHFNPFNIIALLQKSTDKNPDNSIYLDKANSIYQKFPSDKSW